MPYGALLVQYCYLLLRLVIRAAAARRMHWASIKGTLLPLTDCPEDLKSSPAGYVGRDARLRDQRCLAGAATLLRTWGTCLKLESDSQGNGAQNQVVSRVVSDVWWPFPSFFRPYFPVPVR